MPTPQPTQDSAAIAQARQDLAKSLNRELLWIAAQSDPAARGRRATVLVYAILGLGGFPGAASLTEMLKLQQISGGTFRDLRLTLELVSPLRRRHVSYRKTVQIDADTGDASEELDAFLDEPLV